MKSWYFASKSAHEFISTGKNWFKLKLVIIEYIQIQNWLAKIFVLKPV